MKKFSIIIKFDLKNQYSYISILNFISFLFFQIYQLGRETIILLLECNPDIGPLLDWVVDRCYTAPPPVADACFLALATIFSARLVAIVLDIFNFKAKSGFIFGKESDFAYFLRHNLA